MKRIDAIVRTQNLESVKDHLIAIGVEGLTVAEVKGFGRQKGRATFRGAEYVVDFLPKLHLTVIATDEQAPQVVEAILRGARTGKIGDGKIFISPIEEVIRIRSGEWNHAAV
ncbi:MAG TPA: P-II family nitrogen regulator [Candidatus Acidoferrales bacterium]|jgi:nitrogen regulatory protein P-II 1|nr:P-II family nitrogen regulator [Candidatus Acidoferrales bacterium]